MRCDEGALKRTRMRYLAERVTAGVLAYASDGAHAKGSAGLIRPIRLLQTDIFCRVEITWLHGGIAGD